MSNIKLAHISDMHMGSSFSTLSYEKSKIRYDEVLLSGIKAIKECNDCDILLLSGDIFDNGNCNYSVADVFLSAIDSLKNTRVFFSCGNHDSYNTDIIKYCIKNTPDNLHIFPPDKISCVTIDNLNVRVYGASFFSEYQYESLIDTMPECETDYINILCMHADFTSEMYNPLNLKQLEDSNIDYVALGHIHSFSGIKHIGKTFYSYPGILEGRGFDECGEKGYIKGTLSKTGIKLNFCSFAKRKYIDEIIDIGDFKSEYDLIDVMNSICESDNNICKFTFIGNNLTGKQLDIGMLSVQCRAFHCICIDNTKVKVSVSEYKNHPGLIGACARETDKRLQSAANDEEQEKIKKAFNTIINIFENK